MIEKGQIKRLVENHLEGTDKFLVDIIVKPGNKTMVIIDGDTAVNIDDCKSLSRFIESNLDREAEDFELSVSSPGADYPIQFKRQYNKNIGRILDLVLNDDNKIAGKLIAVAKTGIEIEPRPLEEKKKKLKKAESTETAITLIPYQNIKQAKVRISFK
ncbi:MAG: ribosome assembly cofactor RimP [Bacteroidetes bacterium]|nr:ribosome assembly cofactor RimP [Bacteroidota bacterium]